MELYRHLQEREAEGCPIRVGLVGCGQMGSGLVHVTHKMEGMETLAIADIDTKRAVDTFKALGLPAESVVVADKASKAEDILRAGKYLATADALMLPKLENLDAVVEATGVTEVGAQVAWTSIMHHTPIVMLNVETDVTVGALLDRLARNAGTVYTVASGDEPGVCKMLYNFARTMGFEVVCLGKGKNNPIDYTITPDRCAEEAASKDMNPKMLASFIDGTKTMVEMAAVSNATGLLPDVPGMYGPKVEVEDLAKTFIPKADGGIFERRGAVDYSTGKVAPGVFAIVTSDKPRIVKDMAFLGMGNGPYYLLYRPYHLCNIETPISIAEAVIYGETTVTPLTMHSEVVCVAKRDLKVGEQVGGFGSADIYGRIYTYAQARTEKAIPIGIAPGGKVIQDIAQGDIMTGDNFAPDSSTLIYRLRKMQDAMLEMEK